MKQLKFKDVAALIASREGKKIGVNIAQISEILNVLIDECADDVMVLAFLIQESRSKLRAYAREQDEVKRRLEAKPKKKKSSK
jgi:DNA-binding transcriptional MerR regulator